MHAQRIMASGSQHGRRCRYRALMNFLSNVLREDGGFEYKRAIVDSILILIKDIPDAKEPGLAHLCEFIEVRSAWRVDTSAVPCRALAAQRTPFAGLPCCPSGPCLGQSCLACLQIEESVFSLGVNPGIAHCNLGQRALSLVT